MNFGKEYFNKALWEWTDKTSGKKDVWTVEDSLKGVSILGGTGSGKTSASGRTLALKYLREGWGDLCFVQRQTKPNFGKIIVKKPNGQMT